MHKHRLVIIAVAAALLSAGGLPRAGSPEKAEAEAKTVQKTALDERELAALELQHSRARDNLLAAEARLSLLAEKLYDSRLVVNYQGTLDTPFRLAAVELWLDGALAYRQEFSAAPTAQALKLFDGYLIPGRHVLELRLSARGPGDPPGGLPGFSAASGLVVHLRKGAVTRTEFEAEQDGDAPGAVALRGDDPEGNWQVEIDASFETEPKWEDDRDLDPAVPASQSPRRTASVGAADRGRSRRIDRLADPAAQPASDPE